MPSFRDDLVAWRNAPFGFAGDQDWAFVGENLAGATGRMQIRPTPGDTATPMIDLANVSSGQGLVMSWNSTFPDPDTGAAVGAGIVRPQILKATLQALATAIDPTMPLVLWYDLKITPVGGVETMRAWGTFTVNPGVTI